MRNHVLRSFLAGVAAAFTLVSASAQSAAPPEKVALTNVRIITVSGEEIPKGTILIESGKITAVGTDVELPYDAMEVDLEGKVVMPGLIDPQSWNGLDIANESQSVVPFLDVYDAMDPSRLSFEEALRDGITTVHVTQGHNTVIGGQTRVVRPIGLSVDEMTVAPSVALKMSMSPRGNSDRMRHVATFRETFLELDDYLARLAERKYEEKLAAEDKKVDVGPAEARERGKELITDQDYDDQHANLVRLRRGDIDAWIYIGNAMDVAPAVKLAVDQGFLKNTVFIAGSETFRAMGELKEAGRPVVLPEQLTYRERDEITGEIEEYFLPKLYHDAGLMFALQPNPNNSIAERYLTYQAALCVRNGIPRNVALKAITLNPATMLGLGDRLGSIEVGKTANLTVYSGDPLDFNSWVEHVYIDGILAYDRAKDPRLTELLKAEEKNKQDAAAKEAAEKPAAPEGDAKPAEGDGNGNGGGDGNGNGNGDGGNGR